MTRTSIIIRFILAGLIVLCYLLFEGYQMDKMDARIDAVQNSMPIIDFNLYQDVQALKTESNVRAEGKVNEETECWALRVELDNHKAESVEATGLLATIEAALKERGIIK